MKKEWQQLRVEVVQMEDVVAKLKAFAYSGYPGSGGSDGCSGFDDGGDYGCVLFDPTDPPCYNPARV